ncbi:MAG TPA: glutamate--cysteine ligase [Candidatus Binatia bacterium]|nr:glutamate--cysteine ligase [Candidatus Binatia bacterium]
MPITFTASERSSLGVEVELVLVDPESRELVNRAHEILTEMSSGHPGGIHPKAKGEFFQSTIEVITGICLSVGEARRDLAASIGEVRRRAGERGLRLMCAGTHPFTDWSTQLISPDPRYHRLADRMQWPARQLAIFGIHFHVGVRSGEKAIAILNALCNYIPHLLGLSASSPYWMGQDTGLASSRSKIFEVLPTAGLPHMLPDWRGFEGFMETLIAAETITSVREVWWDIRPHPGFGTVETRVCDGMPTLEEICAGAAVVQCLVERFNTLLDRGYTLPRPAAWIVRENKWRAARYGLDAAIIVDERGTLHPLRAAIEEMVDELMPVARRLDCASELEGVFSILEGGASCERQRAIVAGGGNLLDVVDSLCDELDRSLEAAGVSIQRSGDGDIEAQGQLPGRAMPLGSQRAARPAQPRAAPGRQLS